MEPATPDPRRPGEVKDALLARPGSAREGERNDGVAGLATCGATKLVPEAARHDCAVMWLAALLTPLGNVAVGKLCHVLPTLVADVAAVKFCNAVPGVLDTASHGPDDAAVKICGRPRCATAVTCGC